MFIFEYVTNGIPSDEHIIKEKFRYGQKLLVYLPHRIRLSSTGQKKNLFHTEIPFTLQLLRNIACF